MIEIFGQVEISDTNKDESFSEPHTDLKLYISECLTIALGVWLTRVAIPSWDQPTAQFLRLGLRSRSPANYLYGLESSSVYEERSTGRSQF
ncbi:Trypanothione reductase [Dirofilaria immitis]